jgi:carbon storage regulator
MRMLVLSRKPGEKLVIGGNITVTLIETRGNQVRLGIEAPGHVRIVRGELLALRADSGDGADPSNIDLATRPVEWDVPIIRLANPSSFDHRR